MRRVLTVAIAWLLLLAAPAWAAPEFDEPAPAERRGLCSLVAGRLRQLQSCLAGVPRSIGEKLKPLSEGVAANPRVPRECSRLAASLERFKGCFAGVRGRIGAGLRPLAERLGRAKDAIWMGSAASLATAEFAGLTESATLPASATRVLGGGASRVLGSALRGAGALGSVALLASGANDLRKAKTSEEKLDAVSDGAWGVQGVVSFAAPAVSALSKAVPAAASLVGPAAAAVSTVVPVAGAIGAGCQLAAGCKRIYEGHKEHDRSKMKLGALDAASGAMWLAWDVAGCSNPAFLAAYAGTMVAREAYANRETIKRLGGKACTALSNGLNKCRARLGGELSKCQAQLSSTLTKCQAQLGCLANSGAKRRAEGFGRVRERAGSSLDAAFEHLRHAPARQPSWSTRARERAGSSLDAAFERLQHSPAPQPGWPTP